MPMRNGSTDDDRTDVQVGWTGAFAVFLAAVVAVVAILGADARNGDRQGAAPYGNKGVQASYQPQS
ncbi:hypothetical protein [Azospirillum sp. SYSU D00513]|uniref:hypothetical protein n=1 Tax=Azospirillum sp. SYSU D00513 TaxID=2812561 RepID=UPI001A974924|nr:hypothetical protein [Azospirillum sp. SYSU D00513]